MLGTQDLIGGGACVCTTGSRSWRSGRCRWPRGSARAACHSLTGAASVGPSLKGLAGSTVALTTGQTVSADDRYLEESITKPDAQVVKGYHPGVMPPAIASFNLAAKPQDVAALVAFIKAQR